MSDEGCAAADVQSCWLELGGDRTCFLATPAPHLSAALCPAADVRPEVRLATSGTQAAKLAGGELVATFQLEVDAATGAAKGER